MCTDDITICINKNNAVPNKGHNNRETLHTSMKQK